MIAHTFSATVLGIEAHPIDVEVDVSRGLNQFNIVGLPDGTIRESRDRILAAISNSGFSIPVRKIVVNLAPANLRKVGSGFDLPIAVALLAALGVFPAEALAGHMLVGELSLDGSIRPVRGTLPIAMASREQGLKNLVLPQINEAEASVIPEVQRVPVTSLEEVIRYFQAELSIPQGHYNPQALFEESQYYPEDFQEVKGQERVKRAMEVAAAGNHNLLMLGPPGSGKTMLARRMVSILPPPSFEEALEITRVHSIAGLLADDVPLMATRGFRSPHHTISQAGLVGGGSIPGPGEISLAHNGVLFLDELPEFPRNVLELLRQPLEDRKVTIARASMSLEFPCSFMLVAAMNPCPCGYFGSHSNNPNQPSCHCAPIQIRKYRSKVSGPLLDRIDIQLFVPGVDYEHLSEKRKGEASEVLRERVCHARHQQEKRFCNSVTRNNAGMSRTELEEFAELSTEGQKLLKNALTRMGLSARAYDRILKVSRTIADLSGKKDIETAHVAEAIQYRNLDRSVS